MHDRSGVGVFDAMAASRRTFRSVLLGAPPPPDRVLFHNVWFRGHNNPRYESLLPRLRRLDSYLITCSDRRLVRGVQFRAARATRRVRHPVLFRFFNRRYRLMLASDLELIPHFHGRVVADVDDPRFTEEEVELLGRPNVEAYVVTDERMAHEYEALGLEKPHEVVPQGVNLSMLDPVLVASVAERRRPGTLVIVYVASWHLARDDRDGTNPVYNVEHLLDLWASIRTRIPSAELWLIGQASSRVRERCAGRPDIVLWGRLSQPQLLAHLANADIALYPRTSEEAPFRFPVKVAEYLALGIPAVAYDGTATRRLAEAGGGVLVPTPTEFVAAVQRLGEDAALRAEMAATARRAGLALDWDALAARYEAEILNRYLW